MRHFMEGRSLAALRHAPDAGGANLLVADHLRHNHEREIPYASSVFPFDVHPGHVIETEGETSDRS